LEAGSFEFLLCRYNEREIIQIRFAVHEYNNTAVEAYGVKITQEYC
jgi:hypothetical protein